ncbi:MAG: hypothetical protein J1F29_05810 [Lentimicrobiaceae bacterium]|nr:hypothetical protein [Lentimicrobiaceae bacterium]
MKTRIFLLSVGILALGALTSCKKNGMDGKLSITFSFTFNNNALIFDDELYTIESKNAIRIDNIQYFISDPVFVDRSGSRHSFTKESNKIHYVDSDRPATLHWNIDETLPAAIYDFVEFVYGLAPEYNHTGMFSNVPESLMFWPESMGGGYHHLKINGWYAETAADTILYPFGFHAGMDNNYLPLRDTLRFFLADGLTQNLRLNMEVANWFKNPHVWNFAEFGGSVMQNAEAQRIIKENAYDVFSIR